MGLKMKMMGRIIIVMIVMMLQDPDYDHLTCGVVFILVVLLWLQVCCLMFNSTYLKENLQDHELDDDNK